MKLKRQPNNLSMPVTWPKRLDLGGGVFAVRCEGCEGRGVYPNRNPCVDCEGVGYEGVEPLRPLDGAPQMARLVIYAARRRAGLPIFDEDLARALQWAG